MTLGHWIILAILLVGILGNLWPSRSHGPVDGPGEEEF